jgi:hypothetical protein
MASERCEPLLSTVVGVVAPQADVRYCCIDVLTGLVSAGCVCVLHLGIGTRHDRGRGEAYSEGIGNAVIAKGWFQRGGWRVCSPLT